MLRNRLTYTLFAVIMLIFSHTLSATAQVENYRPAHNWEYSSEELSADMDTARIADTANGTYVLDSLYIQQMEKELSSLTSDSSRVALKRKTAPSGNDGVKIWRPNPTTATWLALVFPGGGQIYNRKYWKLPIVYGGFVGCLYAYNWNGQMYKDYRQAYLDIMDSDPNTDSYKDFFRPGYDYEKNKEYLKEVFKKRKDRYRRWRDLSIFATIGVYALSVIDAYVDAQLSSFDITEDINLTIEPSRINSDKEVLNNDYYGLNFNITF